MDEEPLNKVNPWGTDEELDDEDVFWKIAEKYTLEEFSKLSFDAMLEEFDLNGTSSPTLFDIFLKKGEEDYLQKCGEREAASLEELRKELTSKGENIKLNGFEGKTVQTYPLFVEYTSQGFPSLKEWQEVYGNAEIGAHKWAYNLGNALLIELWDSMAKNDQPDNRDKIFIRKMFELCNGMDRQFGYAGRRASIVINCLIGTKSDDEELSSRSKRSIALLGMLRKICRTVASREEFWPYKTDSKTWRRSLNK